MIDHERLLAIIASAGTLSLGDFLTYREQDDLMTAVGPLIEELAQTRRERDAYLNDLRISNDVGHEWANRAQDLSVALLKIQARAKSGFGSWTHTCHQCIEIGKLVVDVLGA